MAVCNGCVCVEIINQDRIKSSYATTKDEEEELMTFCVPKKGLKKKKMKAKSDNLRET